MVFDESQGGLMFYDRPIILDEDDEFLQGFPSSLDGTMICLKRSDALALISKERSVTYAGLCDMISRYSALISSTPCTKVAIFSENRPEWVYIMYAGWKSGYTVVPIDYMSPADEVAYILADCKPEKIFCSRRKFPELEKALLSLSYAPEILVFEECLLPPGANASGDHFLERDDDDTALIIYTSGTTGSPKGAMISFANIAANVRAVSEAAPIFTPESRVLVLLPIHHVLPLGGTILAPLFVGACCVFSPSIGSRDILETLQHNGVTVVVAVPRFYSMLIKGIREKIQESFTARALFALAKKIDHPGLSKFLFKKVHERFGGKIRFLVCGGAAIDDDVARDFKALGFDMLTGYGMTETAPLISFTHPGTLRIGASGYVCPAVEVRIVDGEITVRGRHVMKGYYNRPEETAAMIRDGWLHTGDLGFVDEDGFLFVTGRKKDIIVLSNGKNINPEEIEAKLLSGFNAVKEVAVCLHNGVLHAIILPDFEKIAESGKRPSEEFFRHEVIGEYNHRVASTKKIMKFTLVQDELPKTRLGKIRRFQLPELLALIAEAESKAN
ncbi:MAG: AMP-binding protein [Synergistaceae bacterium]|nr:AMP-binding protein [Synergistaceae bacterium]MDD3915905.1 AMP-binding protein [Synergistaceae bacterium]